MWPGLFSLTVVIGILLFLCLAPYCLVVVACAVSFLMSLRRRAGDGSEATCRAPRLSVVICTAEADVEACARNVMSVARALREDDSITVVADHVSASSLSLLRIAASRVGVRMQVVENDGPRGKKHAQRKGVSLSAEGSVVVCADADCSVGGRFAESVRSAAAEFGGRPFLLLLPVEMQSDGTFFGRLAELEFGCLQVVTGGTAMMGRPTMANGAGMAFTKDLFMGHDAKTAYASGDDMFLLAHALREGACVRYLALSDALVSTSVPSGVGAYLRQRTRWLAKAGGYRSAGVVILALVVFVAVMSWPVAAVAAAFGLMSWAVAAAVFALKLVADASACAAWIVFRSGWRGLCDLWVSVPLEVVYPLMTIVVAARAAVADKRKW